MNRRDFLIKLGLVSAGAAILPYRKRLWPGADFNPKVFKLETYYLGFEVTDELVEDDLYGEITRSNLEQWNAEYLNAPAVAVAVTQPPPPLTYATLREAIDRCYAGVRSREDGAAIHSTTNRPLLGLYDWRRHGSRFD